LAPKYNFRPKARAGIQGIPHCSGCEVEHSQCPQKHIYGDAFVASWHRTNQPKAFEATTRFLEDRLGVFERWGARLGCHGKPHFETAMKEFRAEFKKH
jgi:hypothetical protein